jgi:NAD(P)-dependent dehydrogenase (short-subunit alcohol dehydrogenase family)
VCIERKVAVITGASQGIGASLVRGFLDRGDRVVANSRSIQPDPSPDVFAVAGDITDPAVADRVIDGAVGRFGRVDTLVNNAGVFVAKSFTEYTTADFAHVLSVNLAGFFHVSQRAVRTKGGLDAVTRSLAIEHADKGIRVNAVAPGASRRRCTRPRRTPSSQGCTRWGGWARSGRWSRRSSTWSRPRS